MDLNTLAITGRLGADPQKRETSSGKSVVNLRVAVKLGAEKTLWLDVTLWGKQAELCEEYLKKGNRAGFTGYLDEDEWEADDGSKRTRMKMVANRVHFLESASSASGSSSSKAPKEVDDSAEIDGLLDGALDDEFPI